MGLLLRSFISIFLAGNLDAQQIAENPPKDAFGGVVSPLPDKPGWLRDVNVFALPEWTDTAAPAMAGVHRELPADADGTGEWIVTPAGERVWRMAIHSKGAASLRLHFAVSSKQGRIRLTAPGRELEYPLGSDFWTGVVSGPTVVVEYVPDSPANRQLPFRIDLLAHGFTDAVVCAEEEFCTGVWRDARRGVAMLRWEADGQSQQCGAFLVNTRTASGAPFLLTGCAVTDIASAIAVFDSGEQRIAQELLAADAGAALLRLDRAPVNAYFLGWSAAEPMDSFPARQAGTPATAAAGVVSALLTDDGMRPFSAVYPLVREFLEDGAPCTFQVQAAAGDFAARGGSGSFAVRAAPHCSWNASSSAGWLRIDGQGAGDGTLAYTVSGNPSAVLRQAAITVGGQTFPIRQSGVPAEACEEATIAVGDALDGSLDASCLSTVRPGRFARRYRFEGKEGQRVILAAESDEFDVYVYLLDGGKRVLMQNDDGGDGASARLPAAHGSLALPYTGTYSVEVTSSPLAAVGDFRLAACPGQTPIGISAGQTVNGSLTAQSCLSTQFYTQLYSFQGTAGQQATIAMTSTAIDSYLILNGPNNLVVAEDDDSGGGLNARIPASGAFTLPLSGTYVVEASTWTPFQQGSFTLSLALSSTGGGGGGGSGATPSRFVAVTPCRISDTRAGEGKTGAFGPPTLGAGQIRDLPVPSSTCGIPQGARAYSLNVTVIPRAGALGFLTIWPTGQTRPNVSTLNSFDGRIVANAAIVPAGTNGSVSVYVTDASDIIVDINGYFAP